MGVIAYLFHTSPAELFAMEADDLEFWRKRSEEVIHSLERK